MQDYSITNECMSYESADTRQMFGRLLDEARERVGFDSCAGRLFIQVYPSKCGGCEVYVTTDSSSDAPRKNEKRPTAPKKKREYCFYSFDTLEKTIELCRALKQSGYSFESFLYANQEGKGEYYLCLQEEIYSNQAIRKKCINKSDLASEYGKRVERKGMMHYIKEHTKNIVSDDAVGVLCRL